MNLTAVSLTIVIVAIFVAAVLYGRGPSSRTERLCRLFNLDPSEYDLIGSDLGGSEDKVFFQADGIVGAPDAVFRRKADGTIVVGEAKRRSFRGALTAYEHNQLTLYLGLAHRKYRTGVRGLMHYGCGSVVPVPPDGKLYRELLSLIPEYRRVSQRLRLM